MSRATSDARIRCDSVLRNFPSEARTATFRRPDRRRAGALDRHHLILQEIAYAAAAMAQAENWRHGIDDLLARLGRAVNVSRVFLFEIDPTPDGKLAHTCRHDWSAPGLQWTASTK